MKTKHIIGTVVGFSSFIGSFVALAYFAEQLPFYANLLLVSTLVIGLFGTLIALFKALEAELYPKK